MENNVIKWCPLLRLQFGDSPKFTSTLSNSPWSIWAMLCCIVSCSWASEWDLVSYTQDFRKPHIHWKPNYPESAAFAESMHKLLADEAHFQLNSIVNCQNFLYWATDNSHTLHERPQHSFKVTVWCGIGKFGVIGYYFFEETGSLWLWHLIVMWVWLTSYSKMSWENDRATAHADQVSMTAVRRRFLNHLISRFGDLQRPPHSPDVWFFPVGFCHSNSVFI